MNSVKKYLLPTFSILLGLMFVNSGLNKFFMYMPMPSNLPEAVMKDNAALVEISWLLPLVAVAEIVGGLLIMCTRMRALGALILFPVIVGIVLTHVVVAHEGLPIALVVLAIETWMIIANREKYLPLVR